MTSTATEDAMHKEAMARKTRKMTLNHAIDDLHTDLRHLSKRDIFDLADSTNSGTLTFEEFEHIHTAILKDARETHKKELEAELHAKKAESRKNFYKKFLVGALVLVGLQIALNGCLTGLVSFMYKDQFAVGGVISDGNNNILSTQEATDAVPLYVAPVLTPAQRESVKQVSVKYVQEGETVELNIKVGATFRPSNVHAEFWGVNSDIRLVIKNGEASIWIGSVHYAVCAADVTCSAFKVPNVHSRQALINKAEAALYRAGVSKSRRQLYHQMACNSDPPPGGDQKPPPPPAGGDQKPSPPPAGGDQKPSPPPSNSDRSPPPPRNNGGGDDGGDDRIPCEKFDCLNREGRPCGPDNYINPDDPCFNMRECCERPGEGDEGNKEKGR